MIKRETPAAVDANAHHRALRRCHGCGSYARPSAEAMAGRVLCERCFEKGRRGDGKDALTIAEA